MMADIVARVGGGVKGFLVGTGCGRLQSMIETILFETSKGRNEMGRVFAVGVLSLALALALSAGARHASAHSGGLAADGCHYVHSPRPKSSRHCHGGGASGSSDAATWLVVAGIVAVVVVVSCVVGQSRAAAFGAGGMGGVDLRGVFRFPEQRVRAWYDSERDVFGLRVGASF